MPARRHHYVSEFYLKRFVADPHHPLLRVIDRKDRKSFVASPDNVALERDFHTIDTPGQPPDAVEAMLAQLEGNISQSFDRIIAARSIQNEEDRAYLLSFLTLLCIKTPGKRQRLDDTMHDITTTRFKMLASDPEAWRREMDRARNEGTIPEDSDVEELRELVLADAFKISLSTPAHLKMEFENFHGLIPYIFGRKWVLLQAPQLETGFITSDEPVCLTWFNQRRPEPPGLGLPGTQLLFPISNELAMVGTFELREGAVTADENLVAEFNGNIALHSNRQIYARDIDFRYILQHSDRIMRGSEMLSDPFITEGDD
jgi:hypothetical protein